MVIYPLGVCLCVDDDICRVDSKGGAVMSNANHEYWAERQLMCECLIKQNTKPEPVREPMPMEELWRAYQIAVGDHQIDWEE